MFGHAMTRSKPFDLKQKLQQECALFLLLFNIFIAKVILVLQRFSEDVDILAELVLLQ